MKKTIAVIMGGYTSEFEISLKSGAVVAAHLDPDKYEVYPIVITKNRWTYTTDHGAVYAIQKENFSLELPHKKVLFDGVFNAIHGSPGEDGKIQAYPVLELNELFFGLRNIGEELHLDLYLDDLPIVDDAPQTDAALMFLDAIVGEYDLMTRIHSVNWLDLPEDPLDHGLKPLIELRKQFDLLRPKRPALGEALH